MRRMKPYERKEQILDSAVDLTTKHSYMSLTAEDVAERAECGRATIYHYWGSFDNLIDAVILKGIVDKIPKIIAEAIINSHPFVRKLHYTLRRKAAEYVYTKK